MYIFIDESGNFSKDKDGCFIVGGFITSDPKRTSKSFRKWQHTKFTNKKLRFRNEVKFSDTRLTERMRLKTLRYFVKQDIRVFYSFLKPQNIPLDYRRKKGLESGRLYAEIVAQTLNLLLPTTDLGFRVFRDNRQLKRVTKTEFNKIIALSLLPRLPAKVKFEVRAIESGRNPNIQIADWICGALYRYYCGGKNAKDYFLILKNSIIASDELFKDYWLNFQNNKKPPSKKR